MTNAGVRSQVTSAQPATLHATGQDPRPLFRFPFGDSTPGEIVLMHVRSNPSDHSTLDADSLPRVVSGLRAADYGFVTLDALGAG